MATRDIGVSDRRLIHLTAWLAENLIRFLALGGIAVVITSVPLGLVGIEQALVLFIALVPWYLPGLLVYMLALALAPRGWLQVVRRPVSTILFPIIAIGPWLALGHLPGTPLSFPAWVFVLLVPAVFASIGALWPDFGVGLGESGPPRLPSRSRVHEALLLAIAVACVAAMAGVALTWAVRL